MHDDSFDLGYLERIYIEKLSQCGRIVDSHSTRFASLLQNSNIGLTIVQSKDGGKYRALRTERLEEIVSDSDWIQLLRRVIQTFYVRFVHQSFSIAIQYSRHSQTLATRHA